MTATSALWLFPLIAAGGVLQAMGGPMNNALRVSLVNPWLATLVSFALIVPVFLLIAAVFIRPLPSVAGLSSMPWWAPLGGIVGAVAVVAGLLFIGTIGAGTYAALTVSANLLSSIVIDHYGWFGIAPHSITPSAQSVLSYLWSASFWSLLARRRTFNADMRRSPGPAFSAPLHASTLAWAWIVSEARGVAQAVRGQALDAYLGASLIERPAVLTERKKPTLPGGEINALGPWSALDHHMLAPQRGCLAESQTAVAEDQGSASRIALSPLPTSRIRRGPGICVRNVHPGGFSAENAGVRRTCRWRSIRAPRV